MKIPRSFVLAGVTWRVERVSASALPDLLGQCDFDHATIRVRRGLRRDIAETVFWHELAHAIAYTISDTRHCDEGYVSALANMLHQFDTTKR